MPTISKTEYAPLKAFFLAWHKRFLISFSVPEEINAISVLNSLEQKSLSKARSGLGLAISDVIEMSWDLAPSDVAAIVRDFSAAGITTLSELRRRYSRQFRRVLKRGKIRDESEFYLISGILGTFTTDANEEERTKLDTMIKEYENLEK